MNSLQTWKRERLLQKFGNLSSTEALELAIQAEDFHRQMQPTDPAKIKFMTDCRELFEFAELQEKAGL